MSERLTEGYSPVTHASQKRPWNRYREIIPTEARPEEVLKCSLPVLLLLADTALSGLYPLVFHQTCGCCWVAQWNVPYPSTSARASTPVTFRPGKRFWRIAIASASRGSENVGTTTTVFPM